MNQRRNHSFRSIHPLRKPLNFDARKIHSFHVDSFLNQSDCNRMVSNPTANRHRGFIYSRARVVNPGWVFIVIYREAGSTRRISAVYTRDQAFQPPLLYYVGQRLDEASETGEILECHFIYLHVQFRSLTTTATDATEWPLFSRTWRFDRPRKRTHITLIVRGLLLFEKIEENRIN